MNMTVPRKKLIEVAIPLEAINAASAREKSIRHGHPSTLHLWWARRPLAACRAVLFAQLVDDPSSHPDKFPTVEAVDEERKRLFDIIEELVVWENSTNEAVLERARAEIRKSCGDTSSAGLRSVLGRRLDSAGSAASGPARLRQRSQSRRGDDRQGDDRDSAEVQGPGAGASGYQGPQPLPQCRGACRGCETLRRMDARAGVRTHRPSIPASGPAEGAWRRQGDRDRLDMVTHGAQPGPGVRGMCRCPSRRVSC